DAVKFVTEQSEPCGVGPGYFAVIFAARSATIGGPKKLPALMTNRICIALVSLALGAGTPAAFAASASFGISGSTFFSIDGVDAGSIRSWEGADLRADVVVEPTRSDLAPGKHLGQPYYTPLQITLSLPLSTPVMSWINDFCTLQPSTKTLVISDYNSMQQG